MSALERRVRPELVAEGDEWPECEGCGARHDFGQAIACIYDLPLDEARVLQRRILGASK